MTNTERARSISESATARLIEQIERGDSETLAAFFRTMGRFHSYSFNNVMLIMAQRPEATRVAGFRTWKSLGRSVKKGEKGLLIIAPMQLRSVDGETDAANGRVAGSDDTDDVSASRLAFRAVHVFDISQTEGDPLPDLDRTGGDPGEALPRLEAAIRADGITLEDAEELGGAEGTSSGGRIRVLSGLPPAERFATLVHEWAHEKLHHGEGIERPIKAVRETEAEAVTFVVGEAVGLETGNAAADYIRLYRGDAEKLLASLDRIQGTAASMIDALTAHDELLHHQGKAEPRGASVFVTRWERTR